MYVMEGVKKDPQIRKTKDKNLKESEKTKCQWSKLAEREAHNLWRS